MNTALLVVDMQNDFVLPGASLCVDGAQETVPTIRALLDEAREKEWKVIHVVREHRPDGSDAELGRAGLFGDGFGLTVAGSPGAHIVAGLEPIPGEYVVRKRRFSAFFQTELDMLLRRFRVSTLVIAGTQYPNCIRATATDALCLDYKVIVVTNACSAQTPEIATANIRDMQNMGVLCTPFSGVREMLSL